MIHRDLLTGTTIVRPDEQNQVVYIFNGRIKKKGKRAQILLSEPWIFHLCLQRWCADNTSFKCNSTVQSASFSQPPKLLLWSNRFGLNYSSVVVPCVPSYIILTLPWFTVPVLQQNPSLVSVLDQYIYCLFVSAYVCVKPVFTDTWNASTLLMAHFPR